MLKDQMKTLRETEVFKGRMLLMANAGLVVVVVLMALVILTQKRVTVLMPPFQTTEKISVGGGAMDAVYAKQWGLMTAMLAGNITPKNVTVTVDLLSGIMSAALLKEMRLDLMASAELMKADGYTLSFTPKNIIYDHMTQTVFVIGKQTEITASGVSADTEVTYETNIRMYFGMPQITRFSTYDGQPNINSIRNAK